MENIYFLHENTSTSNPAQLTVNTLQYSAVLCSTCSSTSGHNMQYRPGCYINPRNTYYLLQTFIHASPIHVTRRESLQPFLSCTRPRVRETTSTSIGPRRLCVLCCWRRRAAHDGSTTSTTAAVGGSRSVGEQSPQTTGRLFVREK